MRRTVARGALTGATLCALALLATACGSSQDPPEGAKTLSFKLTDAGCDPHNAEAPAGPVNFDVENAGSPVVTELEVLDGETVLGEKENLTEGLSGSFVLTLEKGEYTLICNGGSEGGGTLTVTGKLRGDTSPEVDAAVSEYRKYLKQNADELVSRTRPFAAAR